jgi:hypothetical protein
MGSMAQQIPYQCNEFATCSSAKGREMLCGRPLYQDLALFLLGPRPNPYFASMGVFLSERVRPQKLSPCKILVWKLLVEKPTLLCSLVPARPSYKTKTREFSHLN